MKKLATWKCEKCGKYRQYVSPERKTRKGYAFHKNKCNGLMLLLREGCWPKKINLDKKV